jgi:hypothetical protein
MKETLVKSDLTGNVCENPIEITINKPGHVLKVGTTAYIGASKFDVDESELSQIKDLIVFEKNIAPSIKDATLAPTSNPGTTRTVKANLVTLNPTDIRDYPDYQKEQ